MLTRRELASAAWYGALFSAVVGWAMLRGGPAAGPASRAAEGGGEEHGELRRVTHRVVGP